MFINQIVEALDKRDQYIDICHGTALSTLGLEDNMIYENVDLDTIVTVTNNSIYHTVETVLPAIKTYVNMVEASVERSLAKISEKSSFSIHEFEIPKCIKTIYKRDEFKIVNDVVISPAMELTNKMPDVEEIRKLATISEGKLKQETHEYISLFSDEHLEYIWEKYFSLIKIQKKSYTGMSLTTNPHREETFLVFLIYRGLKNKAIDSEINSDEYIRMYQFMKRQLKTIFDTNEIQRKQDTVMYYVKDKVVYVNAREYREYLKDGGDVMAVLGAALNRKYINKHMLKTDNDNLINVFKKEQQKELIKNQSLNATYYRYAIINQALPLFKDLKDNDEKILKFLTYEDVHPQITKLVNSMKFNVIIDPIKVCEQVILDVIYKHTNAAQVVRSIQSYMESDSSISVKYAGIYAYMELVTEYLLTQTEVCNL